MRGLWSKFALLYLALAWMIPFSLSLGCVLMILIRKKYSVAEDDKVSVEVARKWTDELFVMLEEMVPGATKV